jgi:ubiquinone/menaquinone biosynthesis C-methylase UbiE
MHPVDYLRHDAAYRQRRAAGQPGWETAAALRENLDLLAQVFAAPHFPKNGSLLELGCGAGDLSLWAAQRRFEVHGVDISPFAIQWAQEKANAQKIPAHFQTASVLDLPFASDSFDVVLDGRCFHCIIGPDRAKFLAEAYRVLKPGGILHVASMCGTPSCEKYLKQFDPASRCLLRDGFAVRFLGQPETIAAELASAGYKLIHQRLLPRRTDRELDLLLLDAAKS